MQIRHSTPSLCTKLLLHSRQHIRQTCRCHSRRIYNGIRNCSRCQVHQCTPSHSRNRVSDRVKGHYIPKILHMFLGSFVGSRSAFWSCFGPGLCVGSCPAHHKHTHNKTHNDNQSSSFIQHPCMHSCISPLHLSTSPVGPSYFLISMPLLSPLPANRISRSAQHTPNM